MNENVLVIGASGDIGRTIVQELAKEGYSLLLHYHKNTEKIKELTNSLPSEKVLGVYQANLTSKIEIQKMLDNIIYPVHSIVFVSGLADNTLFQETTEKMMDYMLSLHVKAPWKITQHFLQPMIRNNYGKIIFITSIWGEVGASNEVIYSSVKGAQNSFVKALAKEVGPSGILVNGISPGFIDTKMNQHLNSDEIDNIISEIPLNRVGLPSDVANAVSFLMSEKASYIQGDIIKVTGGW